jgi:hypothetical protein
MKNNIEKVYNKLPKKVNLKNHKVDLNLIDDINREIEVFEDAVFEASYLAYEYGDEVIKAYDDFRYKYDIDNYIVNTKTILLEEIADRLENEFLYELELKAEELGISPDQILSNYSDIKQKLQKSEQLVKDAENKYREVTEYAGIPNDWN